MQRNKNSVAPDRKLQSQLRENVVDAAKQAVDKLLKAELLRREQEEEAGVEDGDDRAEDDCTLAEKIQAEVSS